MSGTITPYLCVEDGHAALRWYAGALGAAVTIHVTVEDCAAALETVRAPGGLVDREPEVTDHGTLAVFRDPFGHRWMLDG